MGGTRGTAWRPASHPSHPQRSETSSLDLKLALGSTVQFQAEVCVVMVYARSVLEVGLVDRKA